MRIVVTANKEAVGDIVSEITGDIAKASHSAIGQWAAAVGIQGRAAISKSGIRSDGYWNWRGKWYAGVFKTPKEKIYASAFSRHGINLARVFEEPGFTIAGNKRSLLWLPIEGNVPRGAKNQLLTPREYVGRGGKLKGRPNGPPILFDYIRSPQYRGGNYTFGKPMYHGVEKVTLSSVSFGLRRVVARATADIPKFFQRAM